MQHFALECNQALHVCSKWRLLGCRSADCHQRPFRWIAKTARSNVRPSTWARSPICCNRVIKLSQPHLADPPRSTSRISESGLSSHQSGAVNSEDVAQYDCRHGREKILQPVDRLKDHVNITSLFMVSSWMTIVCIKKKKWSAGNNWRRKGNTPIGITVSPWCKWYCHRYHWKDPLTRADYCD